MEWQNKRKPTDRTLESKVLEKIPDADLFRRMQEVESNLDALVQRKRLDLQDMIGRSMRKNETLRIFLSSSVANQPWQEGTELFTDPSNPNWTLRIEGRLVHDSPEKTRAFSSMITSVIVELNKKRNEDANDMEGVETSDLPAAGEEKPITTENQDFGAENNNENNAALNVSTNDMLGGTPGATTPGSAVPGATPGAGENTAPSATTPGGDNTSAGGLQNNESSAVPGGLPSAPISSANSTAPSANPSANPSAAPTPSGATPAPSATNEKASSGEPESDEVVEWHEACVPPEQRVDFDGLDVKRSGSEPVEARILIQLKEYPDKFKLSPQLAEVLGVTEESKPGAVVSLWQYIRYHNLQDVDEKRLIKCNEPLFNLFKREKIMLPQLVELLAPHLSPREPITVEYTIDPTQDVGNRDLAFDVPIQVDHPLRGGLLSMLSLWHHDNGSINKIEDLLLQDVQALNLLAHQHDFYREFGKDPVNFLDKLVASQARDLKIIYCDRQFSEEAVRHSSFYTDDLINPSLHLFLSKQ